MSSSLNSATGFGQKIPSGYKAGRLQQFSPEQMQLFSQLFSNVSPDSYLNRLAGGDQSMFDEMERPALRQFGALQGNIASRFSGMGSGARRSSGFQNAMNTASSDFAQQLQSNRQSLQRQALMDLMGISNNLLQQKPYENFLVEKQQKEGFNWGGAAGGLLGGIGGFFAGGPIGAMQGAGLGYNVGSGLSGNKSTSGYSGGFEGFGGNNNSNSRLLAQAMRMRG